MDELSKICIRCNCKIIYKNKNSYHSNKNRNSPCKDCRHELHSLKLKGKKRQTFSEEWRKNISKSHKNSEVWKKSMNTDEYKRIHRENKLGEKNVMYGRSHSEETKKLCEDATRRRMSKPENRERLKNRKWTEEQKEKHKISLNRPECKQLMRENRLKQIKESGKFTSFNRRSCEFFKILNEKFGWNGQFALNGGEKGIVGYSVDYFEPNLNLVIEWDEKRHYNIDGTLKEKDVIRQNDIQSAGVDKIIRIDECRKLVYDASEPSELTKNIQSILNEFKI